MRWKKLIILFVTSSLTLSANITDKIDLMHTLERSRVLSMRIIKSHALVGTGNPFNNPEKQLEKDYTALKKNLTDAHDYLVNHPQDVDTAIPPLIQKAQEYFAKLAEGDLLHAADADHAIPFFQALEKSRVQINKAAEILTQDKAQRDYVFFTTRISTIAQKMGAVYLYKVWGIALPDLDKHFAMMTKKSAKSMKALKNFAQKLDEKTRKDVLDNIKEMQLQLQFFIMSRRFKSFIPTLLYDKSNRIEQENIKIEKILNTININY